MPIPDQIQEWKDKHGDVYCINVGAKDYHLRKPTRPEHRRFIDTVSKSMYDASLTLVLACLLEPTQQEFIADTGINPNLHLTIVGELQEAMGGNSEVAIKKL